jgi:hypothetical protein
MLIGELCGRGGNLNGGELGGVVTLLSLIGEGDCIRVGGLCSVNSAATGTELERLSLCGGDLEDNSCARWFGMSPVEESLKISVPISIPREGKQGECGRYCVNKGVLGVNFREAVPQEKRGSGWSVDSAEESVTTSSCSSTGDCLA